MAMAGSKQYPKIYYLGHKENEGITEGHPRLNITEKIDGSNMRFWLADGGIHFGTHKTILGSLEMILEAHKKHMHRQAAQLVVDQIDADDLNPDYTYFVEMMMIKHTLVYEDVPPIVGFDIWMEVEPPGWDKHEGSRGRFMQFDVAQKEFERLGVPTIPVLYDGKDHWRYDQLKALIGDSHYGGKAEGIAIKSYDRFNRWGRQLFAKIVRDEFKEKLKATWGQKKFVGPEGNIVQTYCLPARIVKMILKLRDEGHEVAMELMKQLPRRVFDDMVEENWREIVYIRQPIDFKAVRRLLAKKCVSELRRFLAENIGDGDEN